VRRCACASETGAGTQVTDSFVIMAYAMLVPVVIFFALPLAVIGAFVAVAGHGHATNVITGLTVSLQAAVLLVAVIAAGICIAYSVDGGPFGVALAAAAMLSMAGIVVAAAILTPIGMPTVPSYEVVGIRAPLRGRYWRTGRSRPASERTMNTIWWTCSVPGGNPPTRCTVQKTG
jgi:Na+/H+-translocating membrane pyrophosphatase